MLLKDNKKCYPLINYCMTENTSLNIGCGFIGSIQRSYTGPG